MFRFPFKSCTLTIDASSSLPLSLSTLAQSGKTQQQAASLSSFAFAKHFSPCQGEAQWRPAPAANIYIVSWSPTEQQQQPMHFILSVCPTPCLALPPRSLTPLDDLHAWFGIEIDRESPLVFLINLQAIYGIRIHAALSSHGSRTDCIESCSIRHPLIHSYNLPASTTTGTLESTAICWGTYNHMARATSNRRRRDDGWYILCPLATNNVSTESRYSQSFIRHDQSTDRQESQHPTLGGRCMSVFGQYSAIMIIRDPP